MIGSTQNKEHTFYHLGQASHFLSARQEVARLHNYLGAAVIITVPTSRVTISCQLYESASSVSLVYSLYTPQYTILNHLNIIWRRWRPLSQLKPTINYWCHGKARDWSSCTASQAVGATSDSKLVLLLQGSQTLLLAQSAVSKSTSWNKNFVSMAIYNSWYRINTPLTGEILLWQVANNNNK